MHHVPTQERGVELCPIPMPLLVVGSLQVPLL